MALQTFTASQVLTAAQMTALQANDYNQTVSNKTASYVLVAADKGTTLVMNSATATTITVNTALFTAGDTLKIQNIGAGACVVTAGTATVTSSGSLSIPQWGGGTLYFTSASAAVYFSNAIPSGLTLIKSQTIGSAVSSVAVTGAFSTTYDNYLIIVSGGVGSATSNFDLQLGATTSGYKYNLIYAAYGGSTVSLASSAAATAMAYAGQGTTGYLQANVSLQAPFLSQNTFYQAFYGTATESGTASGALQNTTSYTDFTLKPTVGTITGGTIRVFGYQNS
jgi:hypothetical protein